MWFVMVSVVDISYVTFQLGDAFIIFLIMHLVNHTLQFIQTNLCCKILGEMFTIFCIAEWILSLYILLFSLG